MCRILSPEPVPVSPAYCADLQLHGVVFLSRMAEIGMPETYRVA
jgi:hypothetical protein